MISRSIISALALAAFILAVAAGLGLAESAGLLGPDGARRSMQILIGLGLAAYANFLPKQIGRSRRSPRAEARAQAVLRIGGWSMTLAGLTYAGLWGLAPLPVADIASVAVVAAATAVTLGYAIWSFTACRRAGVSD